jgi:hypothetical protein
LGEAGDVLERVDVFDRSVSGGGRKITEWGKIASGLG